MKTILSILLVGALATLARGQVLDSPVTVPLAIEGEYNAVYAATSSLTGSFGGTVAGSFTGAVNWTSGWQGTNRYYFALRPGKDYTLTVQARYVTDFKLHFDPPAGYRVFVENVERLIYSGSAGGVPLNTFYYKVRTERVGSEARGLLGDAGSLRPERILWHVSLGYLRNARGAGAIEIREQSVAAIVSAANLYYDSESAEVDVIRSVGGNLRQVLAPDGLADIIDSGSFYEIRFYRPNQVGGLSGGVYTLTGSPFITYKVEQPGTNQIKITRTQGARTEICQMQKPSSTKWTVSDWTKSGMTNQRTIEYDYPSANVEEVSVKNGATIATRTRKEYTSVGGQNELTKHTDGYGTVNLVTDYAYHTVSSDSGNYRKLKSIVRPDGSWQKYEYYNTPIEARGQLSTVHEPYMDAPTGPTASMTGAKLTEFTYTADWTGKQRRPSTITTKVGSVLTGKVEFSYSDSTVNGRPLVTENRTEYVDGSLSLSDARLTQRKYYRADAGADTFQYWPGRVHSVTEANDTRQIHLYHEGWFNPSLRTFTPNPGDFHILETIVYGSADPGAGTAYAASGYTPDTVYIVPNKSRREEIVRTREGAVIYRSWSVHNGSAWVKYDGVLSGVQDRQPLYHYHDSGRYAAEWTYTDGRTTQFVDQDGVAFTYAYDRHGRLEYETKTAVGASGIYPARPAVQKKFVYDADGRVREERLGAASELVWSRAYDTAGRVTSSSDPQGGTMSHTYPSARVTTLTLPGTVATGGTRTVTTETYRDGRMKQRTGTAAQLEHHAYDIDATTGKERRRVRPTSASDRWHDTWHDWLARPVQVRFPTFLEPADANALDITDLTYCGCGSLSSTQHWSSAGGAGVSNRLTPDRIYQYDAMGHLSLEALDIDLNGTAASSSRDRITKREYRYETIGGATWAVERRKVLPTLNSSTERTALEVRQRLSGLGATQLSQTVWVDAAGRETTETVTVDRAGRVRTATTSVGGVSNNASQVWHNGLSFRDTSTGGVVRTFTYDNWERLVKVQDRGDLVTNLSYYSGTTRVYEKSNHYFTTDRFTYDAGGQVTLHETMNYTVASGLRTATTRYGYNARGQAIRRWGSAVQPVSFEYNDLGQRTKMWTYAAGTTWATSATWPAATGRLTEWSYQSRTGLLEQKKDALGRTVTYEYNLRGQPSKRTEQRASGSSIVTAYHYYDGSEGTSSPSYRSGELKKIDYADATPDVEFTYDRLGRLATVVEAVTSGTRTFAYRDTGDLQMDYEALPAYFGSRRITRTYATGTAAGRPTGFTFGPSGGTALHDATYGYTAATGRLESVARSGQTAVSYGYLAGSDNVTTTTIGNWVRTRTWQGWRDVVDVDEQKWTGSSSRVVASYLGHYDWRGNRESMQLTGELATSQGHASGVVTEYAMYKSGDVWDRDELRETRARQLDTSAELTARYRQWGYDGAHSRTSENRTGGWAASYSNNDLDQVTGISGSASEGFTYDWAGNLVQDGAWTYTYDAENRLIKMQQNTGGTLRLEFAYDYLGRRIEKAVYPTSGSSTPSSRVRFVYDGWNLIAELDALSSNAVLRTYTWGLDVSGSLQGAGGVGGLLRMEEGGTAYHPVYDQSNNVTGLVRTSGTTATLVASYTYGPFGEKLQADWAAGGYTDNNPFRYSTKYTDKETGLVYYGMRYYQPKIGRFINRDPIGEEGGLNLYGFVGNNPVNRFDVLGMSDSDPGILLNPFFVDAAPWRGSISWYQEFSFKMVLRETLRPDVRIPFRIKETDGASNPNKTGERSDCERLKEKYSKFLTAEPGSRFENQYEAAIAGMLRLAQMPERDQREYGAGIFIDSNGNDYSPRATYGVTDVTAGPRGAPGGPIPDWDYRANADFMRYASARGGPYPHGGDIVGIIHTHPIGWPRGEYFSGTTTSGDRRVAHDRGWNVYLLDGSNNMRLYDPRTNAPPEYDPARTRGIEVPGAPSAKEIQQLIDCLR